MALVERYPNLGGVCLNVGCIPSKALLHVAAVITEGAESAAIGVNFSPPNIDLNQTRQWKNGIVSQLTGGLAALAKKRKVTVLHGVGRFTSEHILTVADGDGDDSKMPASAQTINFRHAIIATGSAPVMVSNWLPDDPRVMDSTAALKLDHIPDRLLIIGGGIIGLEMATVFHALGSKISVVEMQDSLMAGADADLVRPLAKRIGAQYDNIWLGAKVLGMQARDDGLEVAFAGGKTPSTMTFDKVLVAVGRTPNGGNIGAEAAGVAVDERGFIAVDRQMRTAARHIFAIGDVVGEPMLAHKAAHQGHVAAEAAAGMKTEFAARVIPSVAYTDPEVAWVGITERDAKQQGIDYGKGSFPWAASGRAQSQGRAEGVSKLLFEAASGRIIGAGVTGRNAGDLIAEAALAIEMNADAEDIALTIHAHPTLAETLGLAAEAYAGVITDLYVPPKKPSKPR